MPKFSRHILVLLVSFLAASNTNAQSDLEPDDLYYELVADSTIIREATFDATMLKDHRESSKYNYDLDPQYEDDFFKRLITKLINWIEKWLPDNNDDERSWPTALRVFFVLLAIGLIVFALVKSKLSWIFNKQEKESEIVLDEIDIEVDDDKLQKFLDTAIAEGQYRLAIRYEFIILLKSMESQDLITWKKAKTNYEYIDEIEDVAAKNSFKKAVTIYEHVWYGDFAIEDENRYRSLSKIFKSRNTLNV